MQEGEHGSSVLNRSHLILIVRECPILEILVDKDQSESEWS